MPATFQPSEAANAAMSSHTAAWIAGVAHDALLHVAAAGLELRLDQRDELRRAAQQAIERGQHQLERDEADIDRREVRRLGKPRGIERADIGLLQRHDRRIGRAAARASWPRPTSTA